MLIDEYYQAIDQLYAGIRETQRDKCIEAGKVIADAAATGHCVHIFDSGHIVNRELIDRGGGLMLWRPFKYKLEVENPVRKRDRTSVNTKIEGLAAYALRASGALPGDVIIIGSVSGKTLNVVDLALEAKKFGLTVIVLTAISYSSAISSDHPSGKHLYECGDIVIDNLAPAGDAMLEVPGLDAKLFPASGLANAFIMWSITAVVAEELLKQGLKPAVYKSYNFPGGWEYDALGEKQYEEKGY